MTQQINQQNWKIESFEEVVDILDSKRVPINSTEREKRIGKIPYYGATGQVGWIDNYLFDEELVLLGEDGAPFLDPYANKAYLIKGKSWVNNHAHVLRAKKNLLNKFLLHFLNNLNYREYISGTTRYKLNQARMKEIKIPLPSLKTQSLIVSAIESNFSKIDNAIKNLKSAKTKIQLYRKAVLKKAFEKKEGWEEKRIGVVCEIISGSTPKTEVKENWGGNIPWITPKDLSKFDKKIIEKTSRYITQKGYDSCSTTLIPEKNVLMSSRAPIGYLVINKVPMCTNQGFKSFRIKDRTKLNEEFLYYYLKSIVEKIKKEGSGTTFNELSKSKAENILIKFPPSLATQKQIVSDIESKFSVIDKIEEVVDNSLKKTEKLKKSILKSAFEGRLVEE